MLTYAKLFEGVLRKLDKFGSPDFDIPDFNFFMPQAVRNVLTAAIDAGEASQKTTDNIQVLMARIVYAKGAAHPEPVLLPEGSPLPVNYLHLRKRAVRISYRLLKPYGRHTKLGEVITATATRVDADQMASTRDNYFLRASIRDPQFRVMNNKLEIAPLASEYWEPVKVETEYFKLPPAYVLDEDEEGGPTEESGKRISVFPDYMDDHIIEECVRLVQRSTGDERVQINPGANASLIN